MPHDICMFCMGFLNEANLAKESALYGDVGGRPQVVWPNAILASTTVGIAVQILTNWGGNSNVCHYYSYDGNKGTTNPHPRLQFLQNIKCGHYNNESVGDPVFKRL